MVRRAIVAIDDDMNFLDYLKGRLDDLGLLADFEYRPIGARGQTPSDVSDHCASQIDKVIGENLEIALALVDIVIIEHSDGQPRDRSGLEVAKYLNAYVPDVPI